MSAMDLEPPKGDALAADDFEETKKDPWDVVVVFEQIRSAGLCEPVAGAGIGQTDQEEPELRRSFHRKLDVHSHFHLREKNALRRV